VALRLLDQPGRERRAARMTLKTLKRAFLQAAKGAGLFQLVGSGRWRRNRLLILCYHGVSIDDEHEWNPALYISQADFVRRLTMLEETGTHASSVATRSHSGSSHVLRRHSTRAAERGPRGPLPRPSPSHSGVSTASGN
jgi:hypothetical protein